MKPEASEFIQAVKDVVSAIPVGKVLTYGDVAALIGYPSHARMVGHTLAAIGIDTGVPCQRVVNSQGRTAPHWHGQSAMLRKEGVLFRKNGLVDMARCRWCPGADYADLS